MVDMSVQVMMAHTLNPDDAKDGPLRAKVDPCVFPLIPCAVLALRQIIVVAVANGVLNDCQAMTDAALLCGYVALHVSLHFAWDAIHEFAINMAGQRANRLALSANPIIARGQECLWPGNWHIIFAMLQPLCVLCGRQSIGAGEVFHKSFNATGFSGVGSAADLELAFVVLSYSTLAIWRMMVRLDSVCWDISDCLGIKVLSLDNSQLRYKKKKKI
jgi:hypothetical protein